MSFTTKGTSKSVPAGSTSKPAPVGGTPKSVPVRGTPEYVPVGGTPVSDKASGSSSKKAPPEPRCIHLEILPQLQKINQPGAGSAVKVCPICFAAGIRSVLLNVPIVRRGVTFEGGTENTSFAAGQEWGKQPKLVYDIRNNITRFRDIYWGDVKTVPYKKSTQLVVVKKDAKEEKYIARGTHVAFKVEKGQNGEAYHGLLAALLSNSSPVKSADCTVLLFVANTEEAKCASQNQINLLQYFLPDIQLVRNARAGIPAGYLPSKPMATKVIASYFQNNKNHSDIFAAIRNYFNDIPISSYTKWGYTTPSEIAGFYMNAYLSATGQKLLPPKGYKGTVVVIYVRTGHTAKDKRLMTMDNLTTCLESVKEAFGKTTGTVILMGDIGLGVEELEHLIDLPANVKLLCVSSPFYAPPKDQPLPANVQKVWTEFKANNDYMPSELKYLGIYLAFRDRYGERLAVIGWRSGTLDGAAFLGIPVYSLDNIPSWDDSEVKVPEILLNGQYLYSFRHFHKDNNVTEYYKRCYDWDLFEAEANKEPVGSKRDAAMRKAGADSLRSERMEELATTIDNFILINVTVDKPIFPRGGTSYFSLKDYTNAAGNHLMAALKVFLLTNGPDGRPLWTQRLARMNAEDLRDKAKRPLRQSFIAAGLVKHHPKSIAKAAGSSSKTTAGGVSSSHTVHQPSATPPTTSSVTIGEGGDSKPTVTGLVTPTPASTSTTTKAGGGPSKPAVRQSTVAPAYSGSPSRGRSPDTTPVRSQPPPAASRASSTESTKKAEVKPGGWETVPPRRTRKQ